MINLSYTTLFYAFPPILVVLYLLRKYIKGAQFTDHVNADGLVALVTGANTGLGFEIARELNLHGAKVYLLCRNRSRGEDAISRLSESGCNSTRLLLRIVDLSDFKSIRTFVDKFRKDEDKVDILVNNAAVGFYDKFERTVDGNELAWQCNYLGHFLLTELLLPFLKASPSARIVHVSALLHLKADSVDPAIVNDPKHFGRLQPYNRSKLAQVMNARELTRRLRSIDASNVVVNACHPGVCVTDIARHTIMDWAPLKTILHPLKWFFFKTSRDGAQTPVFLALSPTINGISGQYFSDCKMISLVHDLVNDADACRKLYDYSRQACHLDDK